MFKSKNHKTQTIRLRGALAIGGLSALLVSAAGCGGTKVSGNTLNGISPATPASYGLEAYNAANAGGQDAGFLESSGLASADGTIAYITGATDSTATPLSSLGTSTSPTSGKTTIPLGFAPGGQFTDSKLYGSAPAGGTVVFRAAISNGQSSTQTIPISSVTLTSSDFSGTQTLGFNSAATTGPLANALYISSPFTVPGTTGLHSYVVTVSDTSGQSSTTTYAVPVAAGTDAGILAQVVDSDGNPVPNATVTITNPVAGTNQAVSDAQGVVVLFTQSAPGTETISVTNSNGTATVTVPVTAGQTTDTTTSTDSDGNTTTTPLQITEASPAPAAAEKTSKSAKVVHTTLTTKHAK